MTNEERIKSMSRWELAEFIYKVSCGATKITDCTGECLLCEMSDSWCVSGIGEWLMKEGE